LEMKRARATEDKRLGSLRITVSRILAVFPELAHDFGIRQGKFIHQAKHGSVWLCRARYPEPPPTSI
jgi:hypothetical protein